MEMRKDKISCRREAGISPWHAWCPCHGWAERGSAAFVLLQLAAHVTAQHRVGSSSVISL